VAVGHNTVPSSHCWQGPLGTGHSFAEVHSALHPGKNDPHLPPSHTGCGHDSEPSGQIAQPSSVGHSFADEHSMDSHAGYCAPHWPLLQVGCGHDSLPFGHCLHAPSGAGQSSGPLHSPPPQTGCSGVHWPFALQ
jgi:hypothetical protein